MIVKIFGDDFQWCFVPLLIDESKKQRVISGLVAWNCLSPLVVVSGADGVVCAGDRPVVVCSLVTGWHMWVRDSRQEPVSEKLSLPLTEYEYLVERQKPSAVQELMNKRSLWLDRRGDKLVVPKITGSDIFHLLKHHLVCECAEKWN